VTSNIDPEGLIPKIGDIAWMHTDTQYVGDVRVNLTRQCRAPEMGVDLGVWCCGSSGRGARVAYIYVWP
jgi:hypothetical protein